MGNFTETITLKNPVDVVKARDGFIKEPDIRQVTIEAVVDDAAGRRLASLSIPLGKWNFW